MAQTERFLTQNQSVRTCFIPGISFMVCGSIIAFLPPYMLIALIERLGFAAGQMRQFRSSITGVLVVMGLWSLLRGWSRYRNRIVRIDVGDEGMIMLTARGKQHTFGWEVLEGFYIRRRGGNDYLVIVQQSGGLEIALRLTGTQPHITKADKFLSHLENFVTIDRLPPDEDL